MNAKSISYLSICYLYSAVYSGVLGLYSMSIEDGLYNQKHAGYVPHLLNYDIVVYSGSH
jgi:hypothetical protein